MDFPNPYECYILNLNNLCNVFKLNIENCNKITNTYKIIKNHKLCLCIYDCEFIFNEFNKNKFIFSFIVDLYTYVYVNLPTHIYVLMNMFNGLNTMNSVRILQIKCNYIQQYKYVDFLKIIK